MKWWELFQRFFAVIVLVPTLGLALITGIIIRLSSPGPLLIHQKREGLGGVEFKMFKLRSMVVDADDQLHRHLSKFPEAMAEWNNYGRLSNDPRIPGKAARFARRSSIDEFPQLLNVVTGQMNLVGPRPLPLEIVARMSPADRKKRQEVRPGITGLWQVSGRCELDINEMGYLDSTYVENRSVLFDLLIMVRTVAAVVGRRGAY